MIAALLLATALTAQAPSAVDDASGNYCLATGYCRRPAERGPASGLMFTAIGLVALGVTGLRRRTPR